MSNQLKNTEKTFKNIADHLEVDIATEGLWAAIESELPPVQKSRKKLILLWWTGAGAMAFFVFMMAYIFNTTETPLAKKTTEISINHTTKTASSSTKNKETQNKNATLSKIPKRDNPINTNTSENHLKTQFSTKKTNTNNAKKDIAQSVSKSFKILTKKDLLPLLSMVKKDKFNLPKEVLRINRLTNEVPTFIREVYKDRFLFDIKQKQSFIKPLRKNISWYIQFASGINQNWSQIDIKNPDFINDKRFAKETDVYGVTSNLMIGLRKNKWSFALGLSHSMQTSRYTQVEKVITQQEITGVIQTQISDSGTKTELQGQVIETTVHYYDILWHRVHNGLDFQAEIGRTIYRKGAFSMNIYAGLGYNIWTKHTGYYLSPDELSITKIENNNTHPYKNKVGVKYNGAISFNYDWGRMNIGLSPFIKYSNTSILKNSAFYTLKNSQYGLQVRMTIQL